MALDFALLIAIAGAVVWFFTKGPAKLVSFTIMCFDDKVNLLNITCAMGACTIKILSKASEIASLITPIVILISAVVVLLYNVAKFVKLNKDNKDD